MPEPAATVLVVDDEPGIVRVLSAALRARGHAVVSATSGGGALEEVERLHPGVVILDLGLPDLDGVEVCRLIRRTSDVPIIVLTAEGAERRKVEALDEGADDYVTKPFSMPELLARLRAALRRRARSEAGEDGVVEVGRVRIDLMRRRVTLDEVEVPLTPIEYRLLTTLARHAGRVLTHEALLREVWGPKHTRQHHYLRVYMAQLRHKLETDPARPRLLLTETGVGYRMAEPV